MEPQEIRTALLNDIDRWVTSAQFGAHPKYLHVVIIHSDEDMLRVAKQMALLAHFPNFDEKNPETRTRISILGKEPDSCKWENEFGNLLRAQAIAPSDAWIDVPLDVYIEYVPMDIDKKSVVKEWLDACKKDSKYHQVVYTKADIITASKAETKSVFVDREVLAMRAHSVYEAAQTFEIIRADDIEHVEEFEAPIRIFLDKKPEEVKRSWNRLDDRLLAESNRCLADSICVRWRTLEEMRKADRKLDKNQKERSLFETLKNHLADMSRSEHARWNVEKLINGFRPYTKTEVIEDENLCGDKRTSRINYLKKNKDILAHMDICSYSRLCRIDLESVKYDSFLLLAMVKYWERNK